MRNKIAEAISIAYAKAFGGFSEGRTDEDYTRDFNYIADAIMALLAEQPTITLGCDEDSEGLSLPNYPDSVEAEVLAAGDEGMGYDRELEYALVRVDELA